MTMIKKEYQNPSMKIVLLQHYTHLLAGSNTVNSLNSSDGFILSNGLNEGDV